MRKVMNLNKGWKFTKQVAEKAMYKTYDDESWLEVNLPHTWNAIDGANGFDFYKGACWYRREFTVDTTNQNKRVYIEFKGANSIADVYVNGNHMGQHKGGYSIFRFDITDAIEFGETNNLAVKVDNTVVDDVYPQMADFTFYGGIYRNVNLLITDYVHIDVMDYGSQGVYISQDKVSDEVAELTLKSRIVNKQEEDRKVRLWIEFTDGKGKYAGYVVHEVVIPAGKTEVVEVPAMIDQPTLWNGKKNAHLYQAHVKLESFNETLDEIVIPFGLRYFEVDPEKGFFLNGEPLPLNGISRHQDRKDMGWAITEKEHREDMELIKEVGATSIRLAHYQHDQYFYDLCDQEGMVVWAEIPFITVMSKTELEGINAKQQMVELIRQNFNHPSIMFWGIQNEIQISGERPELRELVSELNELTKQEDPGRLTTMANVMFVKDNDAYNYVTDIIGYNKYYGWYQGEAEDFAGWIDNFHQQNPNVSLGISEYGAEGILEYHTNNPKVKDYTEEYHALYHETVWKIFSKRPFLWSTYVWNMFDFGANIRDEGGVKGRNNKGLITYDRKIKKDAFYMYKAHWSEEKFVHIAGRRFVDRADETVDLKVYSNCETVILYADGVKVAEHTDSNRVFTFTNIKLQEGWTEIKAIASHQGQSFQDMIRLNKVKEPNQSYIAPDEEGGPVANWFEMPELADVEIKELNITDEVYSTHNTFRELLANEETKAVVDKYMPGIENHPMFGMLEGFVVEDLAGIAPEQFNEKMLYTLNKELTKIGK